MGNLDHRLASAASTEVVYDGKRIDDFVFPKHMRYDDDIALRKAFSRIDVSQIKKDQFETTEEYGKRLKDAATRASVFFYPVAGLFEYDADRGVLQIQRKYSSCDDFEDFTVYEDVKRTQQSGRNAMGAEWTWEKHSGRRVDVLVKCEQMNAIEYPVPPATARKWVKGNKTDIELKRRSTGPSVVIEVEVKPQTPGRGGDFRRAEWGVSLEQHIASREFEGTVRRVWIGTRDTGETYDQGEFVGGQLIWGSGTQRLDDGKMPSSDGNLETPLVEEKRLAEEQKLQEERKLSEEKRLEEERRLAEEKRLEEKRRLAEEKRLEEERRLAEIEAQALARKSSYLFGYDCKGDDDPGDIFHFAVDPASGGITIEATSEAEPEAAAFFPALNPFQIENDRSNPNFLVGYVAGVSNLHKLLAHAPNLEDSVKDASRSVDVWAYINTADPSRMILSVRLNESSDPTERQLKRLLRLLNNPYKGSNVLSNYTYRCAVGLDGVELEKRYETLCRNNSNKSVATSKQCRDFELL